MAYEHSHQNHGDHRTSPLSETHLFEAQKQRDRSGSHSRSGSAMANTRPCAPPRKPIDEAVTSAFDNAHTSNFVPPELIAQITQNVIKQLQTGVLDGTPVPQSQSTFAPQPPPVQQPVPQSPSSTSGTSPNVPNRVYTPPSPHKASDYPGHISPQSQSGYLPEMPQSPVRESKAAHFSPPRVSSPSPSQSSDISDKAYVRPKGPPRLSTGKEETTLERIWGQLFDEEGHPTARLGQFLRGLAVHIVRNTLFNTIDCTGEYADSCKIRLRTMSQNIASSSPQQRWFATTKMSSFHTSFTRGQVSSPPPSDPHSSHAFG